MSRNTTSHDGRTVNEIDSIRAQSGTQYREWIDASLEQVAEIAACDDDRIPEYVTEAAYTLRERNRTVYQIQSLAEAVALREAADYAISGRYAENASVKDALRRVRGDASEAVRDIRAATEAVTGDDPIDTFDADDDDGAVDRGDGLATDGGATVDSDDDVTTHDDAPRVDGITVEVNDGIRPPAEIVAAAEDSASTHALRTGEDRCGVTMTLFTHGIGRASVPDGWVMSYATTGRNAPDGTPERADMAVVLRPDAE